LTIVSARTMAYRTSHSTYARCASRGDWWSENFLLVINLAYMKAAVSSVALCYLQRVRNEHRRPPTVCRYMAISSNAPCVMPHTGYPTACNDHGSAKNRWQETSNNTGL